jgi:invasion protein IalB
MRFSLLLIAFVSASLLAVCGSARAETIGSYNDWHAFSKKEATGKLCYMASIPQKSAGKYKKRGDIQVVITHRPEERALNIVSFAAGYTYKKDSKVSVVIGEKTFRLFTDGAHAWVEKKRNDAALIKAMKAGLSMVVIGVSSRGTKTTDTYSLKGFSAAYRAISQSCGVK